MVTFLSSSLILFFFSLSLRVSSPSPSLSLSSHTSLFAPLVHCAAYLWPLRSALPVLRTRSSRRQWLGTPPAAIVRLPHVHAQWPHAERSVPAGRHRLLRQLPFSGVVCKQRLQAAEVIGSGCLVRWSLADVVLTSVGNVTVLQQPVKSCLLPVSAGDVKRCVTGLLISQGRRDGLQGEKTLQSEYLSSSRCFVSGKKRCLRRGDRHVSPWELCQQTASSPLLTSLRRSFQEQLLTSLCTPIREPLTPLQTAGFGRAFTISLGNTPNGVSKLGSLASRHLNSLTHTLSLRHIHGACLRDHRLSSKNTPAVGKPGSDRRRPRDKSINDRLLRTTPHCACPRPQPTPEASTTSADQGRA